MTMDSTETTEGYVIRHGSHPVTPLGDHIKGLAAPAPVQLLSLRPHTALATHYIDVSHPVVGLSAPE
jgi:hypothetical protein